MDCVAQEKYWVKSQIRENQLDRITTQMFLKTTKTALYFLKTGTNEQASPYITRSAPASINFDVAKE